MFVLWAVGGALLSWKNSNLKTTKVAVGKLPNASTLAQLLF